MLLFPDPDTAVIDPFRQHKTLNLNCFVRDPVTGESYTRDPRYVAQKAEAYLKTTGIADTVYFGPEAEFFIFDDVRFHYDQHSARATRSTRSRRRGTRVVTRAPTSGTRSATRRDTSRSRRWTSSRTFVQK